MGLYPLKWLTNFTCKYWNVKSWSGNRCWKRTLMASRTSSAVILMSIDTLETRSASESLANLVADGTGMIPPRPLEGLTIQITVLQAFLAGGRTWTTLPWVFPGCFFDLGALGWGMEVCKNGERGIRLEFHLSS